MRIPNLVALVNALKLSVRRFPPPGLFAILVTGATFTVFVNLSTAAESP